MAMGLGLPQRVPYTSAVPDHPPKRKKILQAALHCVALYGPDRLSMAAVAEAAGVARGTVYKYFANSDDLIRALADYVNETGRAGISKATLVEGDTREKLVAIIDGRMDSDTRDAVMRLRQLQPSFTLNFLTAHKADIVKAYEDALRSEFEGANLPIQLSQFAEILCRVAIGETLLMDDRAFIKDLVLALWDAITPDERRPTRRSTRQRSRAASAAPDPPPVAKSDVRPRRGLRSPSVRA
jgi:AcrR family transcriptional regulator